MIRRFLSWLNKKLNVIETNEEMNRWYDEADQWLDRRGR